MKIGNQNPDTFMAECYVCASTKELSMKAFRRTMGIVGFLFICPECEDVLPEKWNNDWAER